MNENDTLQKLLASAKVMHRRNFIVVNAYVKKDFKSVT